MPSDDPGHLHLRRIDPTRNMDRFYMLALQPTLFGGTSLMRNWGRAGTCGRMTVETFDDGPEGHAAFARLERRKRRRGYRDAQATARG